jgi:hypothetical protein
MSLEVIGKLYKKFDTQQIKETFKKREFVIETDEQYPQLVKFELTQDKCNLMDNYSEGASIKVHFNLRGREWNDKYFTNLQAWRIEAMDGGNTSSNSGGGSDQAPWPSDESAPASGFGTDAGSSSGNNDMEDLPF